MLVGKPKTPYDKKQINDNKMKRIGNLFDKIANMDNLILADMKARRGKKDSYGIRLFDKDKEGNLSRLLKSLLDGTFKTSKYRTDTIYEPKERIIFKLPYYPDRILHHAIMNVMEPIWVSVFTADTTSCIKGRGITEAYKRTRRALSDRESVYCLKVDIRKFYPSIDHEVLKGIARKKIKDDRLLMLLDEIIDSAPGVPIGNYLSQYLANLYLAYLGHEIKEIIDIRHYIRYADDMTFFHHDKCFLRNVLLPWLIDRLAVLKLELKGNYQIFKIAERRSDKSGRGIDFVGFVFYKEHIRIRKRTKQNLCRAAARLNKVPNISLTEYKAGLAGWLGWIYDSDSKHLAKKILKPEFYEAIMERHNAA